VARTMKDGRIGCAVYRILEIISAWNYEIIDRHENTIIHSEKLENYERNTPGSKFRFL